MTKTIDFRSPEFIQEFEAAAIARGYDKNATTRLPVVHVKHNGEKGFFHLRVMTNNGNIEVVIRSNTRVGKEFFIYQVAEGKNESRLIEIENALQGASLPVLDRSLPHARNNAVNVEIDEVDPIGTFYKVVDAVEELNITSNASRGKRLTGERGDIYLAMAEVLQTAWRHNVNELLGRGCGLFDRYDRDITIGYSKAGVQQEAQGKAAYREHVVPCVMLEDEAIRMYDSGCSIEQVAEMIRNNLFIVRVSDSEREYIDFELGLQVSMPEGWKFGDDPFARLTAGSVAWDRISH